METKEIKNFYNATLSESTQTYEQERWFSSPQAEAGFHSTRDAVELYALPHLEKNAHVFELGPGPGTWTKSMLEKAPGASFDLVDISKEMLKQAATALQSYPNVTYIESDILDFKPTAQYDFFFSSRIIEYVPEKEAAINTITGAMKSGAHGYIVTKTPQQGRLFSKKVKSPVHEQQISTKDLVQIFNTHNCEVVQRVHVTCVFPALHSAFADRVLTKLCRSLPFSFGRYVSESYALVFKKK